MNTSTLSRFLEKQGIDHPRREKMISRVMLAVDRYGQAPNHMRLKDQLKEFSAATKKMTKAMPGQGSLEYVQLLSAMAQAGPDKPVAFNEYMRGFLDLPEPLRIIEQCARRALNKLGKPGRPSAKIDFIRELGAIWALATGEWPGTSNSGTHSSDLLRRRLISPSLSGPIGDSRVPLSSGF
jgi:hypothetical protein